LTTSAIAPLPHREIWAVDFEFRAPEGERADPICMVARELRTGRLIRLWQDELQRQPWPPFPTDANCLFVAYYASAELGCFLALGWSMPARILDLFVEFRVATNGQALPCGSGLLGAMAWHGLDGMAADEKAEMRDLALRGGPWSEAERAALLDYCQADVDALARLLPRMLPGILSRQVDPAVGLGQALLRGRYMAAAARMEWNGVPIDVVALERLQRHWEAIKARLVAAVDDRYGVFDRTTFKAERFADYLDRMGIAWPRHPTGHLALDEETFRDMAKAHPVLQPLHELRSTLGKLRLNSLAVGSDRRNRCLLSAFRSRTGRNQPSNSRFVFGPATWIRGLIRPPPGWAVAYVDFTSQEMGIAGALSGDQALIDAYQSGDIYLAFAKSAGLAPAEATKSSHKEVRDRCKAVVLGTIYGMGPDTLARRIGRPPIEARELLRLHRQTYPQFWRWSDETVASAVLRRRTETVFGWQLHVGAEFNPRSLMNFPMQANGAEMLRLACCLATERGIRVCAPVHDAILIEAPSSEIDEAVAKLQACMRQASRLVLSGFELDSDATIVRWPDRYMDDRGVVMWQTAMRLVDQADREVASGWDRYDTVG
jgi:DNA polymerase family A